MTSRKGQYSPLGFRLARRRAVAALLAEGGIDHEVREALAETNLLAIGSVTCAEVAGLLQRCSGRDYSASPHHFDPATEVHLFEPVHLGWRWYIKLYFGERTVFISVH